MKVYKKYCSIHAVCLAKDLEFWICVGNNGTGYNSEGLKNIFSLRIFNKGKISDYFTLHCNRERAVHLERVKMSAATGSYKKVIFVPRNTVDIDMWELISK